MSSPALDAAFNAACEKVKFEKSGNFVLEVRMAHHYAHTTYHGYDFLNRIMVTQNGQSGSSPQVTPFAQLDRESLEFMHAKLCEMGGTPPALPAAPEENPRRGLAKPRAANA